MEKSNVEMLRLILEISVAIVVFLVVKFIFKKLYDKFIAQKNKQTKKFNCLSFLNEINQEGLFINLYPLEKMPIDDLLKNEDSLKNFYLKNFYNQKSISVNRLSQYLFFVEDIIVAPEKKEVIIKTLEEATLQTDAKILATIVVRAIEMKIVNKSPGQCFRVKNFILKTIESNAKLVALFVREFEILTTDLLSTRFLKRRNQKAIAVECYVLINKYKPKRETE